MRPSSTVSRSRQSRSQAAAEPTVTSRSCSGRHSACQAPAARSCSCTIAAISVATSPGARAAQATALIAATGLFLWGRVDDPPRRLAGAPSSARPRARRRAIALVHLADLGLRQQRHVARRLADRARGHAQRRRQLGDALARAVPGQERHRQPQLLAEEADHRRPGRAQRRQRARRAAELDRELRAPRSRRAAPPRRRGPTSQPAALSPKVIGSACCSSVRPAISVWRWRSASRAAARAAPSRSATSGTSARRAISIAAVSRMSWLVAPRWTSPPAEPGHARGERAHQRRHRVAGRRRRAADRRDVEAARRGRRARSRRRSRARTGRRAPRRGPAPPRRPASPAARRDRWSPRGPRRARARRRTARARLGRRGRRLRHRRRPSRRRPAGGCRSDSLPWWRRRSASRAGRRRRRWPGSGSPALASGSSGK